MCHLALSKIILFLTLFKDAKSEIETLKNEIFKLKLDYDVEIQKLKKKIEDQHDKLEEKSAKIHSLQNELERKRSKIQELKEVNKKLRARHIVADITNA